MGTYQSSFLEQLGSRIVTLNPTELLNVYTDYLESLGLIDWKQGQPRKGKDTQ